MSDLQARMDELKERKEKLSGVKTRLEIEKEQIDAEKEELEPKVKKAFGTLDLEELEEIRAGLDEEAETLLEQINQK